MSLEGKDFLTHKEAAEYACVSLRHWHTIHKIYGIKPIPWAGKIVFRKTDIARAIEQCQHFASEGSRGFYAGGRKVRSAASR